jgi:hypothetical protein
MPPAHAQSSTVPDGVHEVALAPAIRTVPVVYSPRYDRFGGPPLSNEQVNALVQQGVDACPGNAPWFIYALANRDRGGHPEIVARLLFAPDSATPRLRRGRLVHVALRPPSTRTDLDRSMTHFLSAISGTTSGFVEEYWQVSPEGLSFAKTLETPGADLLPLVPPEGFSETEVIKLVDLVRSNPRNPLAGPDRHMVPDQINGSLPIVSITRDGDVIEIMTGALEAPLSGGGELLRIRKSAEGVFEVLGLGVWVS